MDMTYSCVWRHLGAFVILRLVHICGISTLLIHKNKLFSRSLNRPLGDMTHSCVWCDLGACVRYYKSLMYMISLILRDCSVDFESFQVIRLMCVRWLGRMWDIMTRLCMRDYSFTKTSCLRDRSIDVQSLQVIWLIHVCDMTWAHLWYYDSFTYVTLLHYSFTKQVVFEIAR